MGKERKIILTEKQRSWLVKHYKHTKNDEIMEKLGLSHATLHRFRRKLGLNKSRQFMKQCQTEAAQAAWRENKLRGWPPKGYQIPNREKSNFKKGVTNLQRFGSRKEAERLRKTAETLRKTRASERRRVLFGLPQRTKLKIGHNPKKVSYRYALRKRGYIIEYGGNEAYICESTVRNEVVEQRAARHGIKVKVLPDVRVS